MKLYEIRYASPEDGQTCIVDVTARDIDHAIEAFRREIRGIEIRSIHQKVGTLIVG